MRSEAIIDSRLYIALNLDISLKANTLFQTNARNRAHLARQLLIYDRIVVPTKDFGIVPILISWFGLKDFMAALDSGAIGLLHRKSLLGYAGNGNGISGFTILPTQERPFQWWQEAIFGEKHKAAQLQLRHMCPSIQKRNRDRLVGAIMQNTSDVDYDNEFFMKHIVQETYTDVINDPLLSTFVARSEGPTSEAPELTRLKGVEPNQMRVLRSLDSIRDSVDLVLRVAEINMEILMSTLCGDSDLFTSDGAERLLQNKLAQAGVGPPALENFLRLLQLNDVPDIGVAVERGDKALSDIWQIRQGADSKKFRNWLRTADSGDARELEKAYVQSLGQRSVYNRLPTRIMRFAIIAGIGTVAGLTCPVAGIPAGIAISAIDNFFVGKWLSGYSPRLFLDRLGKLPTQ